MPLDSVLIVDDEPSLRHFLSEALTRKGFQVTTAENGKKALSEIKLKPFDLVITDMKMPELSGIELLHKIKERSPETVVIVMTAFGTIESAIDAIKLGAFHYLLKPFTPDALEVTIEKAKEHRTLVVENAFLRTFGKKRKIVATSPSMKKILADVARIAKSNASVLIHGESGTGKELIASAIHENSLRKERPYIPVNCAAIPDTLLESEFFGHEKGSFTGAHLKRVGRFELADKGTLFLDEVTEIPILLQPKLLRAIQEQEFERVGGNKTLNVDVRLISSSNRDLKKAMAEKIFREDLYYRLNVIPIYLPPLRERAEDILPLAHHFLEHFSANRKKITLTKCAEKKLQGYSWPGNIRELSNVMERAVVINQAEVIAGESLHLD